MKKISLMLIALVSLMACSSDNDNTNPLNNPLYTEVWQLKEVNLYPETNNNKLDEILTTHFEELLPSNETWYLAFTELKRDLESECECVVFRKKGRRLEQMGKGDFGYHLPLPPMCVFFFDEGLGIDYLNMFPIFFGSGVFDETGEKFKFSAELTQHNIDGKTLIMPILNKIQQRHNTLPTIDNLENLEVFNLRNKFEFVRYR